MDHQRREVLLAVLTSAAAATPSGARGSEVNPIVDSGQELRKPDGVTLGIGLTCPSPELAQICANSGFDVVLIDMEHGPISIETASRMVTATLGTGAEAWIRVAANDATLIKLALDTGAQSIVVPMVTTKAEAEQAVAAAKYPPRGIRGWGPFRAQYQWRTSMVDYAKRAGPWLSASRRLKVFCYAICLRGRKSSHWLRSGAPRRDLCRGGRNRPSSATCYP